VNFFGYIKEGAMKDKHLGMIVLMVICGFCIGYGVPWAKEIVMMSVPVIAAVIRD